MTKNIVIKLIASMLVLLLTTACAKGNDNREVPQGDPQVEPIEENAPIDLDENVDEPTKNEMNDDFGKEVDEKVEEEVPENYLEKDEETESSR